MEPLYPAGAFKCLLFYQKQTSNSLISQSNELTNTLLKSPFSERPRLSFLMAASVDRAATLVSRTPPPAPRACVNDFPSDDAPAAAYHAGIACVSATLFKKRGGGGKRKIKKKLRPTGLRHLEGSPAAKADEIYSTFEKLLNAFFSLD
jgi:hypothetical protein